MVVVQGAHSTSTEIFKSGWSWKIVSLTELEIIFFSWRCVIVGKFPSETLVFIAILATAKIRNLKQHTSLSCRCNTTKRGASISTIMNIVWNSRHSAYRCCRRRQYKLRGLANVGWIALFPRLLNEMAFLKNLHLSFDCIAKCSTKM